MFLLSIPTLLIPLLFFLLKIYGYFGTVDEATFTYYIALAVIVFLALEMIKSALYVAKGSLVWFEFVLSLALLIGIISFFVAYEWSSTFKPLVLILVASIADVIVGFLISISNARRDIAIN